MASRLPRPGRADEPCFYCQARTKNRLLHHPSGERKMVCETCVKSSPGWSQSSGERVYSYRTDSDLRSNTNTDPDSLQLPISIVDLQNLQTTVATGQYDEVLAEVNRAKANLAYVEGKALHAKADTLETEQEKQKAIAEAYKAASESVQCFRTLGEQKDKIMYAEALLLHANSAARFVRECSCQAPSSNDGIIETAKRNADEARRILTSLNHGTAANAYRVLGVIELCQDHLEEAKTFFIRALREFLKTDLGRKTVWCAVSFWNMHITLKALGRMPESLPWLKKATILHAEIEGSSHPYTKKYRDNFIKLTKDVSRQPVDYDRLTLSDEDSAAMKELLGADICLE